MSSLYTNSQIFCSCSNVSIDDETKLPVSINTSYNHHHLPDLLFCPSCQFHKCFNCCQFDIECKYCSNCLFKYTESNDIVCTKNCFACPSCDSTLSVSVTDDKLDGKPGKVFKFKCLHCTYLYKTSIITKPKPLISIIKSERKKNDSTNFSKIYTTFQQSLIDQTVLQDLYQQQGKNFDRISKLSKADSKSTQNVIVKMKIMELNQSNKQNFSEIDKLQEKMTSNKGITLNEEEDVLNSITVSQATEADDSIGIKRRNNLNLNSLITTTQIKQNLFPIPKKLVSKKSYKCNDCNTTLLMPTNEPLSLKYLTKWNAIDFMPNLIITNLISKPYPTSLRFNHLEPFIINLINPLPNEVSISISILSHLPSNFLESSSSIPNDYNVQLTLPVTDFSIGKNEQDLKMPFIKSIPTPLLTQKTKQSRAELLMRLGKLRSMNRSVSPDDSIDLESTLVEKNNNWALIPFSIMINKKSDSLKSSNNDTLKIKIPFYIIVESKLPDHVKSLGLSKKGLKFGFWNIVDLGSFDI